MTVTRCEPVDVRHDLAYGYVLLFRCGAFLALSPGEVARVRAATTGRLPRTSTLAAHTCPRHPTVDEGVRDGRHLMNLETR